MSQTLSRLLWLCALSPLLAQAPTLVPTLPAPSTPFLSPESAATVFSTLLNAHMEAVRLGWKDPEKAPGQYRWLEERLIATATHAGVSDWEREAFKATERYHLNVIQNLRKEIAGYQYDISRLREELASCNDLLKDRNPPK